MRVLILGLAKSGTSALAYKIANSLPKAETDVLFEPSVYLDSDIKNVVAKVLIDGYLWHRFPYSGHVIAPALVDMLSFAPLDKRILIVRDPKDRLISVMLYCLYHEPYCRDALFIRSVVGLLRAKEAAPGSVRFVDFHTFLQQYHQHAGRLTAKLPVFPINMADFDAERSVENRLLKYLEENPGLFLLRYEDLMDNRLGPLEDFLGVSLSGTAQLLPGMERIERTKTYGNYKNWFTPEDVPYYRSLFRDYAAHFPCYDDFTLNPLQTLRPEHGSAYVLRIVNEARGYLNLEPIAE
ncbi:MAG: hypothetical protein ABSG68_00010 [Thermoguttaceae bacterium]|jgi:hypothetical protein